MLLLAQKRLRDLKARISTQSKKNFVLERDVRYLDQRIALLIQNRMALDEVRPFLFFGLISLICLPYPSNVKSRSISRRLTLPKDTFQMSASSNNTPTSSSSSSQNLAISLRSAVWSASPKLIHSFRRSCSPSTATNTKVEKSIFS